MKHLTYITLGVVILLSMLSASKPQTSDTLTKMYGESPVVRKQQTGFNIWSYNY